MNLLERADPLVQTRRLAICAECPHRILTPVPLTKRTVARCGKCGCVLSVKTKFARATCPINKW